MHLSSFDLAFPVTARKVGVITRFLSVAISGVTMIGTAGYESDCWVALPTLLFTFLILLSVCDARADSTAAASFCVGTAAEILREPVDRPTEDVLDDFARRVDRDCTCSIIGSSGVPFGRLTNLAA